MCLLALWFRAVDDAPVVVGANREEFYDRGGTPPQLLNGGLRSVGGVDPLAGGTWLGVNQHAVLVAVTNRPGKSVVPSRPPSRGQLARQLLGCTTAAEAEALATQKLDTNQYAGCNVVCVDARRAVVIESGEWLRVRPLPPGLHVVTNADVNDASDSRIDHVMGWLGQFRCRHADDCLDKLRQVCAHQLPEHPPICYRGETRGTVSSSLIALRSRPGSDHPDLARSTYLHAQGPPDTTPYLDYSELFQQLLV
jgi:uncharacterized protein with NRDE domain